LQQDDARLVGPKAIGGALRQQHLMAALAFDIAHFSAHRGALDGDGTALAGGYHGIRGIELHEVDRDHAVHDDGELIMGRGEPGRGAFRAQRLEDVAQVDRDHHLFVRPGPARDVEDIREDIVFRIIVDDFELSLAEVAQRAERGFKLGRHHYSPNFTIARDEQQHAFAAFDRLERQRFSQNPPPSRISVNLSSLRVIGPARSAGSGRVHVNIRRSEASDDKNP